MLIRLTYHFLNLFDFPYTLNSPNPALANFIVFNRRSKRKTLKSRKNGTSNTISNQCFFRNTFQFSLVRYFKNTSNAKTNQITQDSMSQQYSSVSGNWSTGSLKPNRSLSNANRPTRKNTTHAMVTMLTDLIHFSDSEFNFKVQIW